MNEARPPAPPGPEVLDRLHLELTAHLLERVKHYARQRVGAKRVAGIPCFDPDVEAEHMATEAATLTILGHRTWNPSVPLFQHLCGVVRSVSAEAVEHHNRLHTDTLGRLSLEDSHGDDAKLDLQLARDHGSEHTQRPKRAATLADARDHLVESLRIMSRGDDHVTMLLDAYQSGCEERADVLDCTGMSADEYRNARRRLDRLVDALPETIKDGAVDALEVSYGY
jgi:hypothetical protein